VTRGRMSIAEERNGRSSLFVLLFGGAFAPRIISSIFALRRARGADYSVDGTPSLRSFIIALACWLYRRSPLLQETGLMALQRR